MMTNLSKELFKFLKPRLSLLFMLLAIQAALPLLYAPAKSNLAPPLRTNLRTRCSEQDAQNASVDQLNQEIRQLKKALAIVTEEREILKKATAILGKQEALVLLTLLNFSLKLATLLHFPVVFLAFLKVAIINLYIKRKVLEK